MLGVLKMSKPVSTGARVINLQNDTFNTTLP